MISIAFIKIHIILLLCIIVFFSNRKSTNLLCTISIQIAWLQAEQPALLNSNTQIFTELNHSNHYWTQPLKSLLNSNTQIITELKHSNHYRTQPLKSITELNHSNHYWTQPLKSLLNSNTQIITELNHSNHYWTQTLKSLLNYFMASSNRKHTFLFLLSYCGRHQELPKRWWNRCTTATAPWRNSWKTR